MFAFNLTDQSSPPVLNPTRESSCHWWGEQQAAGGVTVGSELPMAPTFCFFRQLFELTPRGDFPCVMSPVLALMA